MRKKRRFSYGIEILESRTLLAANLHVTGVSIVDQNANPYPDPTIGSPFYIRIDFTVTDLPANASYTISETVYGTTYMYGALNWGAGQSGTQAFYAYYGAWTTTHQSPAMVTMTINSTNTVAESDYSDNSGSATFIPVQLPVPSKLDDPLGGVPFRNYGFVNYVDQDPSSPGYADYRGGTYTYDGHTGIDMTFPTFASMDAGVPIVAAAAGTVIDVEDGNFDRNTVGSPDANYVVVDQGNGFNDVYYHLRNGSVGVSVGQQVVAGQVIGLVGSSGNSTGTHLHFEVDNGDPVETYENPTEFWENPLPYQGDVDEVTASGVTSYNPSTYLNAEELPPNSTFSLQQSGQNAYAWFTGFIGSSEPANFTYYEPDGSVFATDSFTTGSSPDRGGYYYVDYILPNKAPVGTWSVAFTVDGVLLATQPFTVSANGAPTAQISQSSTLITNGRTTPMDGETVNQGSSATTQFFNITNIGNATLTLGAPTLPPGWTLVQAPATTLGPNVSTSMLVKIDTSVPGYRYGFISIPTNDAQAPNYTFAIEGTVNPSATTPAVSLYTRDSNAAEDDLDPGVIRVQRTGDTSSPLTVNLSRGGTATAGTDYQNFPLTVTIPAGQAAVSVIVTPIDAHETSPAQTVSVALASGSGYTLGPNTSATITIANDGGTGSASLSGTVYLDKNFNTYQDSGETGVSGIQLFLDKNGNGTFDIGEPTVTTNASGNYIFPNLVAGSYDIREVLGTYELTTPVGMYNVVAGQAMMNINLGVFPIHFIGSAGDDVFSIQPDPNPARIDIAANGVTYEGLRSQLPHLGFDNAGNATLNVDFAGGVAYAAQSITFVGNGVNGTINLAGMDASTDLTVAPSLITIGANTISFNGSPKIFLSALAGSTISLASLNLSRNLYLPAGQQLTLAVSSFTMTSGTFDIADNILNVEYTGTSSASFIAGLISTAYTNGAWTGPGITSSTVATDTSHTSSVGYFDDGSGQITVRATWKGDTNCDGTINADDISLLMLSQSQHKTTRWQDGNFNYGPAVNTDDWSELFYAIAYSAGHSYMPAFSSIDLPTTEDPDESLLSQS